MCLEELRSIREEQRGEIKDILANQDEIKKGVSQIASDMSDIKKHNLSQSLVKQPLRSKPDWEEWVKVQAKLGYFGNNHYILIVDRFKEVDSEDLKALANVPWKLVFDLDPNSDIDGFLSKLNPSETKGGVIVTFTPSKLRDAHVDSVVDTQRMQWLFANGRNSKAQSQIGNQYESEDRPKVDILEWKSTYKMVVQDFIRACCQKLKSMKPVLCIVLGITRNISIKIAKEILEEIYCRFSPKFSTNYLSFVHKPDIRKFPNGEYSSLSPSFFLTGLRKLLGISEVTYQLPSSQKNLPIDLTQMQYNFLSEYLEVLYSGCEEIPNEETNNKQAFITEHLKKFICGKAISFASLHYRHDAARNLTKEVHVRVAEMLHYITKPRIVQITHAPGSGGTTIARRVLWDLHDAHPCAIVKLDHAPEAFAQNSKGEEYLNRLCDCILEMEERCNATPAILIDGNSRQVRILSDCIVRKLEGKVLILRCANYVKPADKKDNFITHQAVKFYIDAEDECLMSDQTDSYFYAEDEFKVNPRLKDDDNDYSEFRDKYRIHCEKLFEDYKEWIAPHKDRRERVFHFPMTAMLDEFDNKLKEIVNESLEILKKIPDSVEYSIAIMVAFLQLYAKFPTPGRIVATFFKKNLKTNEDVVKHCSETLINLMVPGEPPSATDYYSDYHEYFDDWNSENTTFKSSSSTTGQVLQSYSFQHPKVAELVLDHSKKSVNEITEDLIRLKVLESYKKNDENRPLIDSLFLYNKESMGDHFSKLVGELGEKDSGGRIFEDAAKQTNDIKYFSHVARFYAYKGEFEKARSLIKEGFEAESNAPVEKKRGVVSTNGYIVLMEMKHKKKDIWDIDCLKKLSREVLELFQKARGNPPWSYPNPLIGEVMLWHFCFDWIIERNHGDVEEAIKFILQDSFFAGAIGECIYLLDEVDRIVETVPTLNNPEHTKFLASERRHLLIQTIGRMKSKTKRQGFQRINFDHLYQELLSKFQKTVHEKHKIRFQVLWMLNGVNRKMHLLERADKVDLFSLLRKLVNDFKMFNHARDLMEAAAEQIESPFEINVALNITTQWQDHCPNDPFSYLFMCMLCFLEIHKGSVFEYRPYYEYALENCEEKSQEGARRRFWQYFLGKDGDGVSALLTRSKLEAQYAALLRNPQESSGFRKKEDLLDQMFWNNHSRDFLFEFTGRIECKRVSSRGKDIPYIMMKPGDVKVNVPKNDAMGTAYMDYQPDSLVSFVVCFTLNGPVAKGIRFVDSKKEKKPIQSKSNRQGRKIKRS